VVEVEVRDRDRVDVRAGALVLVMCREVPRSFLRERGRADDALKAVEYAIGHTLQS
jgi:hypothetical protein